MRVRMAGLWIVGSLTVFASVLAGPIPPGRQYRLTIDGENTITFVPEVNLPEMKVDYQAKIEYIVDSRYGKEPKPASKEKETDMDDDEADVPVAKSTKGSTSKKARAKKAENPSLRATGAIDVSLHSSERLFRQNGQPLVEMKVSRTKFQGRAQPEMPIVSVTAANAPLPLQEIMKGFDVISASLLLNDDLKVVNRKYLRGEGPQRALVETLLSIHVPVPRNADVWDAPTQLVMGQGQTAKGMLRFEKVKAPIAIIEKDKAKDKDENPKEPAPVRVKVSGTLKAEGVVAGRFIKDGTYKVTGEQTFDMKKHEFTWAKWTVAVDNELANPNGQTIARAQGKMVVESRALDGPNSGPGVEPKL